MTVKILTPEEGVKLRAKMKKKREQRKLLLERLGAKSFEGVYIDGDKPRSFVRA